MSFEAAQHFAGVGLPNFERIVPTRRDDGLPVRREGGTSDGSRKSFEATQNCSGVNFPNVECATPIRRNQGVTIGTEGNL